MTDNRYTNLFSTVTQQRLREQGSPPTPGGPPPSAILFNYGDPFPDSFPNGELLEACREAVEIEPARVLQYGAGEVAESLREFVAGRAASRGIIATTAQTMISRGSSDAIRLICQLFLDPGDVIMCEAPTFLGALGTFQNYGVKCEGVTLDNDGLRTDVLEHLLEQRRESGEAQPKFFYAIPTFQNPSGVTMTRERREHLLELAQRHDFVIIEDDAYSHLRYEGPDVPSLWELDQHGRVIYLGTFSKLIAPGVRLGWVFAPEPIISQLNHLAGFNNGLAQSAVARYCQVTDLEERTEWLCQQYTERRDIMLAALERYMPDNVSWTSPRGGLFVWLRLPEGLNSGDVAARAANAGVVVLSGHLFYPDRSETRYLRLAFSMPAVEQLEPGIALLAEVVSAAAASAK